MFCIEARLIVKMLFHLLEAETFTGSGKEERILQIFLLSLKDFSFQ